MTQLGKLTRIEGEQKAVLLVCRREPSPTRAYLEPRSGSCSPAFSSGNGRPMCDGGRPKGMGNAPGRCQIASNRGPRETRAGVQETERGSGSTSR